MHASSQHIVDLGGVTIDLQGGDYLISRPILIPPGYGNLHVVSGTLRASAEFPPTRYLVEVGGSTEACDMSDKSQKSCNENLSFEDLMLDGQMRAKGGLQINNTMGSVVGPVRLALLCCRILQCIIARAHLSVCCTAAPQPSFFPPPFLFHFLPPVHSGAMRCARRNGSEIAC